LLPRAEKNLMPLSSNGLWRRAHHDAGGQAQRAREIRDAGRGQRTAQIHVDAGRGESGLERGFEQIARDARVLADQDTGALAALVLRRASVELARGCAPLPNRA
jgi:hypothetical protein